MGSQGSCALWRNKGRKLLGEAATSISCCHVVPAESTARVANPQSPSLYPYPALVTGAEPSGSLIPVPAVQKQEWSQLQTSKVTGRRGHWWLGRKEIAHDK